MHALLKDAIHNEEQLADYIYGMYTSKNRRKDTYKPLGISQSEIKEMFNFNLSKLGVWLKNYGFHIMSYKADRDIIVLKQERETRSPAKMQML